MLQLKHYAYGALAIFITGLLFTVYQSIQETGAMKERLRLTQKLLEQSSARLDSLTLQARQAKHVSDSLAALTDSLNKKNGSRVVYIEKPSSDTGTVFVPIELKDLPEYRNMVSHYESRVQALEVEGLLKDEQNRILQDQNTLLKDALQQSTKTTNSLLPKVLRLGAVTLGAVAGAYTAQQISGPQGLVIGASLPIIALTLIP